MNSVARVFVVINLLLSAGFLMAAATFLQQNEDWRNNFNEKADEMETMKSDLESTIESQDGEIKRLKDDINSYRNKVSALEAEKSNLDTQKKASDEAKSAAEQTAQQVRHTNTTLSGNVGQLSEAVKGLEAMIERYRDRAENSDKSRAEAEVAKANAEQDADGKAKEIHRLNKQVEGLNSTLEETKTKLGTYVANYPPPARIAQPKVNGTVVRYDRGTELVEINQGKNSGVELGHEFDILRGSDYICTVVVDRVGDANSVGSIKVRRRNQSPRSGDRATKL